MVHSLNGFLLEWSGIVSKKPACYMFLWLNVCYAAEICKIGTNQIIVAPKYFP